MSPNTRMLMAGYGFRLMRSWTATAVMDDGGIYNPPDEVEVSRIGSCVHVFKTLEAAEAFVEGYHTAMATLTGGDCV